MSGNDAGYSLTDEARAEIAEAIRIVREDRFESFVRGRLQGPKSDTDPKPGDPPPPKTGNAPPNPDDKTPPKRGLFWGDRLNES